MSMAPADYKAARQARGTLIARREAGVIAITKEMELAISALPLRVAKTKTNSKPRKS